MGLVYKTPITEKAEVLLFRFFARKTFYKSIMHRSSNIWTQQLLYCTAFVFCLTGPRAGKAIWLIPLADDTQDVQVKIDLLGLAARSWINTVRIAIKQHVVCLWWLSPVCPAAGSVDKTIPVKRSLLSLDNARYIPARLRSVSCGGAIQIDYLFL